MRKKNVKLVLQGVFLLFIGLVIQYNKITYFGEGSPSSNARRSTPENISTNNIIQNNNSSSGFIPSSINSSNSLSGESLKPVHGAVEGAYVEPGNSGSASSSFGMLQQGRSITNETPIQNHEIALSSHSSGSSYDAYAGGGGGSFAYAPPSIPSKKEKEKNKSSNNNSVVRTTPFPNAGFSSGTSDVIMANPCDAGGPPDPDCMVDEPIPLDDYFPVLLLLGAAFGIFRLRTVRRVEIG